MSEEENAVKALKYACQALGWPFAKGEIAETLFSRSSSIRYRTELVRAIDFGIFELKNPQLSPSPIYINLRTVDHPLTPGPLIHDDARKIAGEIEKELFVNGITFDYVAGVPYGGEPLAKAFLDRLDNGKAREARFDKIGQGSDRKIANFKVVVAPYVGLTWKRVLLIDDVLSSGKSLFEAIEAVEKSRYEVAGIAVAVDREQGGYELLAKRGYSKAVSVFRISELLAFGVLSSKVLPGMFQNVMGYLESTREIIANEK